MQPSGRSSRNPASVPSGALHPSCLSTLSSCPLQDSRLARALTLKSRPILCSLARCRTGRRATNPRKGRLTVLCPICSGMARGGRSRTLRPVSSMLGMCRPPRARRRWKEAELQWCIITLAAAACLTVPVGARAGHYEAAAYSSANGKVTLTPPIPGSPFPYAAGQYGWGGGTGGGGAVSCTGSITATFNWVPDPSDPDGDVPPANVIVRETCTATWKAYNVGPPPTGVCGKGARVCGGRSGTDTRHALCAVHDPMVRVIWYAVQREARQVDGARHVHAKRLGVIRAVCERFGLVHGRHKPGHRHPKW